MLVAFENGLVYRPTKDSEGWEQKPHSDVQDLHLTAADGARIHAWWWPNDTQDALIYCHGNAGNLSHRGDIIARLRDSLDVSVLIFDYPGYGKSGGLPTEKGCYAAADAAYDWLTNSARYDPERLLIYGDSLGGGVAIDLASRRPHRALAVVKTFTSAPAVAGRIYPWLPVRFLMRNRFDNLTKIKNCQRPVFIAHGDRDELIPFDQGQQLHEAANMPKAFCPLPGLGHNDGMPPEAFRKLRDFLAEFAPCGAL